MSPGEPRRELPSLVAGASLLVDYILTVAVSVAGRRAAITSAFRLSTAVTRAAVPRPDRRDDARQPARREGVGRALRPADVRLHRHRWPLLIVLGLLPDLRPATSGRSRSTRAVSTRSPTTARGSAALEPVRCCCGRSRRRRRPVRRRGDLQRRAGVPQAREPQRRDDARRGWASSSARCFLGVSVLASPPASRPLTRGRRPCCRIWPSTSSAARASLFCVLQFATFAILILAANTAYADFPRLSSIIARDGYLPRQLANRGDRLVFSNGIIFLAAPGRRADRRLRRQHHAP